LTARERDALALITDGMTNREIGERLGAEVGGLQVVQPFRAVRLALDGGPGAGAEQAHQVLGDARGRYREGADRRSRRAARTCTCSRACG